MQGRADEGDHQRLEQRRDESRRRKQATIAAVENINQVVEDSLEQGRKKESSHNTDQAADDDLR